MEELQKRKMGTHGCQRLDQLFFPAGWRTLFSLSNTCQHKKHTAVSYLSALVTWYGSGGGIGGTVAEIGGRKLGSALRSFCAAFCGYNGGALHAGAMRSET